MSRVKTQQSGDNVTEPHPSKDAEHGRWEGISVDAESLSPWCILHDAFDELSLAITGEPLPPEEMASCCLTASERAPDLISERPPAEGFLAAEAEPLFVPSGLSAANRPPRLGQTRTRTTVSIDRCDGFL